MKRRRHRLRFFAAPLAALAIGGVLGAAAPPATSQAFAPLVYIGVKAAARAIGNNVNRHAAYDRIEANRDQDLAGVATTQQVRDYQQQRGWLAPGAYQRESQRLDALSAGITDRAEREKRITKHDYDHALGDIPRQAAADAITSLPGGSKLIKDFAANLVRGQDPLSAASNSLTDPSRPATERLDNALRQVNEANAAMDRLGGFVRDRDALKQDAVERIRGEIQSLVDPATAPPPSELENRINGVVKELNDILPSLRSLGQDLTGRPLKIDEQRFARDQKWLDRNAAVQALEAPDATKALLGAGLRNMDQVKELLAAQGITLTDEQVAALAAQVGREFAAARAAAREAGEDPHSVDVKSLMQRVVQEEIDKQGMGPGPTEEETPAAGPTPGGAEASPTAEVSPTATEPATATPNPTATPTPPPPSPTPTPTLAPTPTATSAPPTATPTVPPPSPTATATPAPLPIVSVGGGAFVDGNSFSVSVTLIINFKTGSVSGSIHGERQSPLTVSCWNPQHTQVVDVATATLTETWSSGLGGGVGKDGGFSAAFSATSGGSYKLVQPFDVEGCIGREPAFPTPPTSTIAGTLAGTATTSGAVSFSSSTGGSWSGSGSVAY